MTNSFLEKTLECIEIKFEEEVQRRMDSITTIDNIIHPNVKPVIFQEPTGYSTGTIHRVTVIDDYDIWATAKHVTESRDYSALVNEYGECFRLETDDLHDVHFFCKSRDIIEVFKNNCPSVTDAAAAIDFDLTTYNTEDTPIVASAIGFPYGTIDGNPQTRYLVPFTSSRSSDLSNLLWMQSLEGPVVGGMSGGKIMLPNSNDSIGVLVATSYFDPLRGGNPKHYAAIQLFHNEMKIKPI